MQRCHGCDQISPVTFAVAGIRLCAKCQRIALGHVQGTLGAPIEDIRAFVDFEAKANPASPVIQNIVDAMYARCA